MVKSTRLCHPQITSPPSSSTTPAHQDVHHPSNHTHTHTDVTLKQTPIIIERTFHSNSYFLASDILIIYNIDIYIGHLNVMCISLTTLYDNHHTPSEITQTAVFTVHGLCVMMSVGCLNLKYRHSHTICNRYMINAHLVRSCRLYLTD